MLQSRRAGAELIVTLRIIRHSYFVDGARGLLWMLHFVALWSRAAGDFGTVIEFAFALRPECWEERKGD